MSESHSTVEYRPVIGFPGYRVGNDGSVWSCWKKVYGGWSIGHKWKRRKLNATPCGHLYVHLFPRRQFRLVHRLVLEAFVGPRPEGMECRHFPDRNPANNRPENLSWGTKLENHADQVIHGTDSRGIRNPAAKVTEQVVRDMLAAYAVGQTQQAIADRCGLSQGHVSRIVRRKLWKHVV